MSLAPLILLAAGRSLRMGEPKGLLDFYGEPWIVFQVRRYFEMGGNRVIIVLGFHSKKVADALGSDRRVELVWNSDPERGKFSSVLTGFKHFLKSQDNAGFLSPIDVPLPECSTLNKMMDHFLEETWVVLPEYNKKGGHPLLLRRDFLEHLLSKAETDPGIYTSGRLDHEIHVLPMSRVTRVAVSDPGILKNLNTPLDWERFINSLYDNCL